MSNMINFQSLFKFTGEYKMDVHVLKFPEGVYNAFIKQFYDEENKKRNMKILDLNTVLGSYLTDIHYLNFVKASNLEEGWIFASHDEYLDLIKHHLEHWLKRIKLTVDSEHIENLTFEKQTITVSPSDLKEDNYKSRLFLAFLSRHISSKIEISAIKEETEILPLDIIPVNNHPRNRVLCLHPERKVTIKKSDLYFNYYFDIFCSDLQNEEYPYISIEVGTMRIAAYDNIKTVNNGSSLSGIHPYIILNNSYKDGDGDFKLMAFRGEIGPKPKSNEYMWKRNYKGLLKDTLDVELPLVEDVLAKPTDYIDNDKVSILIPHGTHLSRANHIVGSGMDFKMRNNILCTIEGELNELNLIDGSLKATIENGKNNLDENNNLLENVDYLKFDLLYTNPETMVAFKKYVDVYNDISNSIELAVKSGQASAIKKKMKKLLETIEKGPIDNDDFTDATEKIAFLKDFEDACEQFDGVNIKSLKKLYGHLHKKDISNISDCIKNFKPIILNCIDYSDLDTYAIPARSKSAKESYAESLTQLDFSDDSRVVLVELEDKDSFRGKTDPKDIIRKTLAKEFKKTTQFFVPFTTKMREDEKSKDKEFTQTEITEFSSDVITKILLEGIRQFGLVHKRKFDKSIAQVGIVRHEKDFFLTAIIGDSVYGKFRNSSWIPYHDLLILIASSNNKLTLEESLKIYDSLYLENAIDSLFEQFDITSCYVSVLDRQIKNIIPDIYRNDKGFNLKLNFSNEKKNFSPYINKNVSVMVVNDTIDSEWFPIKDDKNLTDSFKGTLCKVNDLLYISTASGRQGVMSSAVKDVMKHNKLDTVSVAKKNYFKSSPIFIYFPKSGENHDILKIAIFAHFTKSQTAIQHFGTDSTEELKLPLSLNITKNVLEFYV